MRRRAPAAAGLDGIEHDAQSHSMRTTQQRVADLAPRTLAGNTKAVRWLKLVALFSGAGLGHVRVRRRRRRSNSDGAAMHAV